MYTFSNCTALESLVIPSTIVKINGFAFGDCTNLKNLQIQNPVVSLEGNAFCECTGLENVTIYRNTRQFLTLILSCIFIELQLIVGYNIGKPICIYRSNVKRRCKYVR